MAEVKAVALPETLSASLTVVDGPDRGQLKRVRTNRFMIGRKTGDLVLRDSKISSEHAVIEYQKGEFILRDLNSTNGTFVNDERINQRPLKNLDEVKLGFTTLLFRLTDKQQARNNKKSSSKDDAPEVSDTELETENSFVSFVEEHPEPSPIGILTATIHITTGPGRGEKIRLQKDTIVFGRVNTDVVIKDDKDISRKHAVLEVLAGNQVFIRDLSSTNGTFVNEQRISHQRIKDGDEVRIGNSRMKISFDFEPTSNANRKV